jgi:hypothetical protein
MPHDNGPAAFLPHFKGAYSRALQRLLQENQLYKSVPIDTGFAKDEEAQLADAFWYPEGCAFAEEFARVKASGAACAEAHSFALPQIKLLCAGCQQRSTFKADLPLCRCVQGKDTPAEQSLLLSYECLGCGKQRITFLVTRRGSAIQLSGRDPVEILPVPSSIPKNVARIYSEAQIADRAGQTLTAIFLLREFIEQFWRSLPELQEIVSGNPRVNGGELAEAYTAQLPLDFLSQYPSVGHCHQLLCEAIQGAGARPDLFQFCTSEILEHLDGRRFRRLSSYSAPPFGDARAEGSQAAPVRR